MTALVIMTEATYGGIPVILLKNLSDCPFLLSMTLVYSYPETKTRLLFPYFRWFQLTTESLAFLGIVIFIGLVKFPTLPKYRNDDRVFRQYFL